MLPLESSRVQTGLDILLSDDALLRTVDRYAVLTHQAAVNGEGKHILSELRKRLGPQRRVFSPEHGLWGTHQDMEPVDDRLDPICCQAVTSLYGHVVESLEPNSEDLQGFDTLFVDLQDVGARYYTYYATVLRLVRKLHGTRVKVVVLDRPNPLGGVIQEGGGILPGFGSFVGELPVPQRHGLTLGELVQAGVAAAGTDIDLKVISMQGWNAVGLWPDTGLPFVPPSPNMPTWETAIVYPGMCLLEGTNLSEGRGTTTPFLVFGAPFLKAAALVEALEGKPECAGVHLLPVEFRPEFGKFAGNVCEGVRILPTQPESVRSLSLALAILRHVRHHCPSFQWRTKPYEFESAHPAIDYLLGSPKPRELLEKGAETGEILGSCEQIPMLDPLVLEKARMYARPQVTPKGSLP